MVFVNLQTHEGTVSTVKKLLAKLVSLDFFNSFGTHIATYTILTRLHKSRSSRDELEFDLSNFV